ncbi:M6 family metalloprotease domain-containing protein [Vibrio sp. NH-UV-68]|uniref:M6 family metalloprotease domain-containing protein n=1 Tax=unclassified Vibrio TaxID=2614977 RepID=UPI0036F42C30
MRMRKFYLAIAATLTSISVHSSTPPAPTWHTMALSDGSVKELRLMGSEELFWYQDAQGTLYVQGDDKLWYFAEYQFESNNAIITSTGVLATNHAIPPPQSNIAKVKIKPVHSVEQVFKPRANHNLLQKSRVDTRSLSRMANGANDVIEQPLLVVQVSFTDEDIENDFSTTIFGQNQQSVQDYFLKNSYGKYKVVPAKETQGTNDDGIIDVVLNIAHPNCHSKTDSSCQAKLNNVFTKAYEALDKDFNMAQYDNNSNGSIEPRELSVMFVFAGNDKSSGTSKTPTIWPHKYAHSTVTIDSKRISSYCLFADYQHDHQSTMGVIAHELGHLMLGLPDLYSYKHDGSIGHWGLMGGGSWGRKPGDLYSGQTPVNMLSWSREAAGFIKPNALTQSGQVQVDTDNGESVVYLDPYLKQFGPRLYLENRRKNGYDQALKGEGLLVTAVNIDNHFNNDGPMQVQVLQADGDGLLESGRSSGDSGDVFPGRENVTLISDTSSPSLISVTAGRNTQIELNNIVSNTDSAYFQLTIPESGTKSAWVTSFGRTYPTYRANTDVLGFEVNIANERKELIGIQFYAKPNTVALPMFYRLLKYPYRVRFGRATVEKDHVEVLARGVAPDNGGQVILDSPISLGLGTHLLVLEIENGIAEYSTQFLDAYLGDGQRKPQYYGSLADYTINGMQDGFSRNFPFAALFEEHESAGQTAVDDYYQIEEDSPLTLRLKNNDLGLLDGEQYSVDIKAQPNFGQVIGNIYYPKRDYHGQDEFTYRLVNSRGEVTNYAKVIIDIQPVNDAPSFRIISNHNQINAGDSVILSIRDLLDVDSSKHNVFWSQIYGEKLSLSGANTSKLIFTTPSNVANGSRFIFRAFVSDEHGGVTKRDYQFTVQDSVMTPIYEKVTTLYEQRIELSPVTDGRVARLELMGPPTHGSAYVAGNKIIYQAPASRTLGLYDEVNFRATLSDGNEVMGSYEIEVVANQNTNSGSQPENKQGDSGGSSSLVILCLLLATLRLRK